MRKILILLIILGFKVSGQNQELLNSQNVNQIKTTEINGHWWTKQNLNVTTFRNGNPIYLVLNKEEWDYCVKNKIPAMMYWNFEKLNEKLGYLYNYWAFVDSRELAPNGFRIPNLKEIEGKIDFYNIDYQNKFSSPLNYTFPENSILKVDYVKKIDHNYEIRLKVPNFYSGEKFEHYIYTVLNNEQIFSNKVHEFIQDFWCFYYDEEGQRKGNIRNEGYFLRCIKDSLVLQSNLNDLDKPVAYLKDRPDYIEIRANDFLTKKYQEVIPIAEGLFKVKNNNLIGLIDSIGTEILKPKYLDVYVCKSNQKSLILIRNNSTDSKWRVYSSNKVHTEFPIQNFRRLTHIKNTNFISVLISEVIQGYSRDMYGIIDFENKVVIKPGKFIYNNKLCHYGFIDNNLNENLIRFSIGENDAMSYLVGFFDKKANIKIKPFYTDYIEDFRYGIAACTKADINKQKAFFFLTKNGKFIKMNEYDKINSPIDKNLLKQQIPPSFQGGSGSLHLYLKTNLKSTQAFLNKINKIKSYGEYERNDKLKASVSIIQFTINLDGTADNFKILNPIGYGCDEQAIKVIKSSNKWIPSTINNEPVRSDITIAIVFDDWVN